MIGSASRADGAGGPLLAGRHMPVDEPLGILWKILISVECPVKHLAGDVLRHVSGPALGRVEGDHAEGVRILPAGWEGPLGCPCRHPLLLF
jgi:hypothetical protein